MSNRRLDSGNVAFALARHIRDRCLCLHVQRAARALARRFDEALRPHGITQGQFSLLMSLNRAQPPHISDVAELLAMDRTTLTANLKPLRRRGLVDVIVDRRDRRGRLLKLTPAGRSLLTAAAPAWQRTHAETERLVAGSSPQVLRSSLRELCA